MVSLSLPSSKGCRRPSNGGIQLEFQVIEHIVYRFCPLDYGKGWKGGEWLR